MRAALDGIADAFGYFSIVPITRRGTPPGPRALAALPFVGAVLGGTAGATGWAASRVVPPPLAAAIAYGALAVLTGAIHLDGYLDGCDAFVASVPPERRMEILDDPRHGTFAVAGMFVAGAVAIAALAAIPPRRLPWALAFVAALARAAAVSGAFVFPGARHAGSHRPHYERSAETTMALGASFGVLGGAALLTEAPAAALVPAALGAALLTQRWICTRVGGLVGDAYGFTIVATETTLLVMLAALAKRR